MVTRRYSGGLQNKHVSFFPFHLRCLGAAGYGQKKSKKGERGQKGGGEEVVDDSERCRGIAR